MLADITGDYIQVYLDIVGIISWAILTYVAEIGVILTGTILTKVILIWIQNKNVQT